VLGSSGELFDETRVRQRAAEAFTRSSYRRGFPRQSAAIMAAPARDEALQRVQAPTLVMHGLADPLVPATAGRATAAAIPRARLELFEHNGHDIPELLWPRFIDAISDNIGRAAP
jgi:pimeloyl-ACP methyl ester carboxylesterase